MHIERLDYGTGLTVFINDAGERYLLGVQIARMLNRETFNIYRTVKSKGIIPFRATKEEVTYLHSKKAEIGVTGPTITLIEEIKVLNYLKDTYGGQGTDRPFVPPEPRVKREPKEPKPDTKKDGQKPVLPPPTLVPTSPPPPKHEPFLFSPPSACRQKKRPRRSVTAEEREAHPPVRRLYVKADSSPAPRYHADPNAPDVIISDSEPEDAHVNNSFECANCGCTEWRYRGPHQEKRMVVETFNSLIDAAVRIDRQC